MGLEAYLFVSLLLFLIGLTMAAARRSHSAGFMPRPA